MVAIIHGTLVHTPIKGELTILHNCLLITNDQGDIAFLKQDVAKETVPSILQQAGLSAGDTKVRYLSDYQFLMPGLVDTHIHAPQ
jgi:guanine deaminase